MNSPIATLLLASVFLPLTAAAADVNCTLKADPDDLVYISKDLEVRTGQVVKDAVVVDGNLTLKKGASVRSAVVLRGKLTVEDGAVVRDHLVVIGGKASVASGAQVKGSRVIFDRSLQVVDEDGQRLDMSLSINGEDLGQRLVAEVLKEVRACRVERSK